MNRWNIPDWLEKEVSARDRHCIYCGVEFTTSASQRRLKPSWEHIINDARIVTRENIALCCVGCNASKGAKALHAWLRSKYCQSRGITRVHGRDCAGRRRHISKRIWGVSTNMAVNTYALRNSAAAQPLGANRRSPSR